MNIPDVFSRVKASRKLRVILLVLLSTYILFFNYTEPTQVGVARNWVSGVMWLQEGGGWHFTAPWVWVVTIDTRPMRVSVPSGGHGYSAKLVQFDTVGWKEFIEVEGWRYWWWSNRLSFNIGYSEEHRGIKDILRGHAYGTARYPFLKVLAEYESENVH